jgi:hypothetical protein
MGGSAACSSPSAIVLAATIIAPVLVRQTTH